MNHRKKKNEVYQVETVAWNTAKDIIAQHLAQIGIHSVRQLNLILKFGQLLCLS
jgi:hypothetical protein